MEGAIFISLKSGYHEEEPQPLESLFKGPQFSGLCELPLIDPAAEDRAQSRLILDFSQMRPRDAYTGPRSHSRLPIFPAILRWVRQTRGLGFATGGKRGAGGLNLVSTKI